MKLEDHLDKLRAFKIIAESGNMRQAAKKLNVTQPSLTRLIQTLESATGVELLYRGRLGVTTTESGKFLLAYTNSILKNLDDLEQKLRNPADKLAGHLKIGTYASQAEYLWPNFIPALKEKAPALRLSIHTSEIVNQQKALELGEIDILVDAEPRVNGDLISWNLYEDRFNFYTSKGKAAELSPDTIDSLTLIYSPAAIDRDNKKIVQHLEEKGYFFKETIELDSFTSVIAFAKKGLGIAVLPQRLAETSVKNREIQRVTLTNFLPKGFGTHHFSATIHESRKDDPRIRFLVRSLRDWF